MLKKSREAILVDIFNEFTNIYNNRHNILPITISSAYEMNEEEQQKIVARIADITGKTILPVYKIDKTIIGGLSIAYDNLIIDASIKSQLKKLHRSLLAA
ncbi:MAG: ATP synthase F1 subunit delta [Bacteroidetes bacterium 4572_77]|nr:MAG: ATP synthase F1 subunit delta [Bacteroidetes bacterium 4572_77]